MVGSVSDIASTNRLPVVYIGDVVKRKCYSYTSSNNACVSAESYSTPQYLAMHIRNDVQMCKCADMQMKCSVTAATHHSSSPLAMLIFQEKETTPAIIPLPSDPGDQ